MRGKKRVRKWDHIPAPDRLVRWREDEGLTQQAAADRVPVDLSSYNAWENARERPGLDYAVRIERITGGYVRCSQWSPETAERAA